MNIIAMCKKPATLLCLSIALYVVLFCIVQTRIGAGMAVTVLVPVVTAAWCFGVFWGAVAALLGLVMNVVLCMALGGDVWQQLFRHGAALTGTVALLGIAVTVGYMHELRHRLQRAVRDLTAEVGERRRAESGLRDMMQYFDNILESSVDSIIVGDARGNMVRVNRSLLELTGYGREELIGQSTLIFSDIPSGEHNSVAGETVTIDEEFFATGREITAQLLAKGRISGWEFYIVRKDKRLVPVEENIVLLRDDDGNTIGSLGIIRDITGRRIIEYELEKHRKHLNELVEAKTGQLLARERQLEAANEQLLAANQQLHAANEQLRHSEEALRESEERFRAVVQLASESIITADLNGRIVSWNNGAELIYGYSAQEMLGKSVLMLAPEENRHLHEQMRADMATRDDLLGMHTTAEGVGLRKDGSRFPLEFSLSRWKNGDEVYYAFIVRDITTRKQAEQQLRALNEQLQERNQQLLESRRALEQSEQQFRQLVETMNEGLLVRDRDGLFSYVNDRFCELLGYSREELLGKSLDVFLTKHDRKILQRQIAHRKRGEYRGYEITWIKSDGTHMITFVSPRAISDENQNFRGSFAVISDITEQKKAEQQRREAQEFLENIFRATNDGIVVSDNFGKVIRVNRTIEKMLGYSEHELLGKSTMELSPRDDEHLQQGRVMVSRLRKKGAVENWETTWLRKDGTFCPVELNITFLRDRRGEPTGAVSAVRDITDRRAIEQQLLQTEKLKSLGELAGGVAHDFNNVLAAILGRAQLLKRLAGMVAGQVDPGSAAELQKGLGIIENAALDGSETVRRIQDFSRKGTSERFFESVDLQKIIKGALEYTRVRWKDDAESKGLKYRIRNKVAHSLPVTGNAAELREVFTNLITNALDAMPQGGTLSFAASAEKGKTVVTIQDTGTGMPRTIQGRIFDPFFTTKGPQSTGLGMSVSYGIINRHNGSISVQSETGRGSVFTVVLPAGKELRAVRPERKSPAPAFSVLRVLVIDDDPDVREVLTDMLSIAGHAVQSAAAGAAGVALFKEHQFDMVFTDLGMPGMSGWEVAKEIKRINPEMPVALVTGWEVQYQQDQLEEHKIDFVVNKPFQVSQIMEVVRIVRHRMETAEA